MVNPGAFRGLRDAFLVEQKPKYAAAVLGNYVAECVADIQRRYFKRFPIVLDHNEDPSPEFLASVDDHEIDLEPVAPNEATMTPAAFEVATEEFANRRKLIESRKEQIKRRMAYMHGKDHKPTQGREPNLDDPMDILVAKLTGTALVKPRQSVAYNLWAAAHQDIVNKSFDTKYPVLKPPKTEQLKIRAALKRSLFKKLSQEEQETWGKSAKDEHQKKLEEWQRVVAGPASKEPATRQKCIGRLSGFAQPFLDLICEHTGMKATLLVGGPEPADGGRLNIISVHSGSTTGAVKATFGESERAAFKEYVIPLFGRFLKRCYTVEECRASALPNDALSALEALDTSSDVDRDWDSTSPGAPGTSNSPLPRPAMVDELLPTGELSPSLVPNHLPSAPRHASPIDMAEHSTNSEFSSPPLPSAPRQPSPPRRTANGEPNSPPGAPLPSTSHQPSLPHHTAAVNTPNGEINFEPPAAPLPPASRQPFLQHHTAATSTVNSELNPEPPAAPFISAPRQPSPPCHTSAVDTANGEPKSKPPHQSAPSRPHPPGISSNPTTPTRRTPQPSTPERAVSPSLLLSPSLGTRGPIFSPLVRRQHSPVQMVSSPTPRCNPLPAELQPTSVTPSTPANAPTTPLPPHRRSAGTKRKSALYDAPTTSSKRRRPSAAVVDGPNGGSIKSKGAGGGKTSPFTGNPPTATAAPSSASSAPSDVPAWMASPLDMLRSEDFGTEWDTMLKIWMKFEASHGPQSAGRIPADKRPSFVGDWVKRARAPMYRPVIPRLENFGDTFFTWWISFQPTWRTTNSGSLLKGDGDLEDLRKPGINGILSVLATLFFWGSALGTERDGDASWRRAVDDLTWVLGQLVD